MASRDGAQLLPCDRCGLQIWWPTANPGGTWYDSSEHYLAMPVVDWLGWYHSYGLAHLPPDARTLLDIGCADGRFVHAAAARGIDARGVDHSEHLVRAGNARYPGERLAVVSAEQLQGEDRQYDVVTMFEVIEHVEQPVALLATAFSLVAPGGTLVVSTPNRLGRPRVPEQLDSPPHHLSRWTPEALRRALGRAGFEDVAIGFSPGHIGLKAVLLQRTQFGLAVGLLRWRAARAAESIAPGSGDVRAAIKLKDLLAALVARTLAPLAGSRFRGGQMVAVARRPAGSPR